MRFDEIAKASLPPDVGPQVARQMFRRWKGARLYIPARPRCSLAGAPERFAADIRACVLDSGGTEAQADELLTAISGGYVWL